MDPFLSDRHARWHPVDLSLFPLRRSIITRSLTHPRATWIPFVLESRAWKSPPGPPQRMWVLFVRVGERERDYRAHPTRGGEKNKILSLLSKINRDLTKI